MKANPDQAEFDPSALPDRWSADDAQRVLAAYRKSGLTIHAFAKVYGLPNSRLYHWRRRLAADEAQTAPNDTDIAPDVDAPRGKESSLDSEPTQEPVRLIRLTVKPEAPVTEPCQLSPFEVGLPNGWSLRVPVPFVPAALQELLTVLEGAC